MDHRGGRATGESPGNAATTTRTEVTLGIRAGHEQRRDCKYRNSNAKTLTKNAGSKHGILHHNFSIYPRAEAAYWYEARKRRQLDAGMWLGQ
jgi:hypothetical protein